MRPRPRARGAPPDEVSRTHSTWAPARSRSAPSAPAEAIAENERVIYQGVLRAETTLAGTRGRDRRRPRLPAPRPPRLRDPRLEARPPDRQRPHPEIELQLADLRLALRADLRRAAGRAPGPQRDRRDRRHPLRGRRRGARGPRARSSRLRLSEEEPHGAGRLVEVLGLRLLRALLAGGGRAALGRPAAVGRSRPRRRARASRASRRYDQLLDRYDAESLAELERPWGEQDARRSARRPSASSPAPARSPRASRSS